MKPYHNTIVLCYYVTKYQSMIYQVCIYSVISILLIHSSSLAPQWVLGRQSARLANPGIVPPTPPVPVLELGAGRTQGISLDEQDGTGHQWGETMIQCFSGASFICLIYHSCNQLLGHGMLMGMVHYHCVSMCSHSSFCDNHWTRNRNKVRFWRNFM